MSTGAESGPVAGVGRMASGAGVAWLALALAGAIAAFWFGLVSLSDAWSTPEYSHGPLIPLLSFYLFLHHLKVVPPPTGPVRDRWPGVALIALSLLIGAIGDLARIPDIVTYALILWVFGLALTGFGLRRGFQFWPAVLHLIFMLPLPAFLYWQVSIKLQFISSEIGVDVIRMMGIPVFLDGNIIDLGIYKLHVAEACSGLRYLFPVMSFSYVFATLYRGPVWHKAVLLLSAAPLTVLMNSFRIGVIGVLVDSYGIEQAEGFLHYFEGWVIFLACVALLFGLVKLMQLLSGERRSLSDALDIDFTGLGGQVARVLTIPASAALIAAALLTAGAAAAWHLAPDRAAVKVDRAPLLLFPRQAGDWRAGPLERLEPNIERVLGADDYLSVSFAAPDQAARVELFVAQYDKQTEGSGIHSPEVCIPAGGWEMSRIAKTDLVFEGEGAPAPMQVNRAVIQKGLNRQLVYYWFEQRGRRLTSDYVAKAYTVFDAVMRGRSDGGLVRLITPIGVNEPEAAADARLRDFMAAALPELGRFMPD